MDNFKRREKNRKTSPIKPQRIETTNPKGPKNENVINDQENNEDPTQIYDSSHQRWKVTQLFFSN